MNWKSTGVVLAIVGAVTAVVGWLWSDSIHDQRHDCRLGNLFGSRSDSCPSKVPAFIVAGVGGVILVIGIALIIGAATAKRND